MNNDVMEKDWFNFQEKIAEHFRSLGVQAETNKTIRGVRTEHDLDVYVTSKYLGTNIKWVIEAKYWQTKIPKEKVLALRTIVDDIGADKGFIISQVGFQSGAIEACQNTNIQLYTFEEFVTLSKNYIQNEILDTYVRRARLLHIRYFSHKKRIRKDYGLRGELGEVACFSGAWLLTTVFDVLEEARTQKYPIDLQTHMVEKVGNDEKILKAEYQMMQDGVFEPNLIDPDLNQKTWNEIAQSMKGVEDKSFQQIIQDFLKLRSK